MSDEQRDPARPDDEFERVQDLPAPDAGTEAATAGQARGGVSLATTSPKPATVVRTALMEEEGIYY